MLRFREQVDRDRGLLQHGRLQRRHARVHVDPGAARRRAADGLPLPRDARRRAQDRRGRNRAGGGAAIASRIVLPHTPELATACLAVSACAAAAPLNPPTVRRSSTSISRVSRRSSWTCPRGGAPPPARSRRREAYRSSSFPPSRARDRNAPPRAAARERQRLAMAVRRRRRARAPHVGHDATPTTPPQHLLASVGNLVASLVLAPRIVADELPMFHVGGIVDVLAAPLAAGGQRRVHAGLRRRVRSAGWLDERRAHAGTPRCPTMHQAILDVSGRQTTPTTVRRQPASVDAFVVRVAAGARCMGRARASVPRARHRDLRHDRGRRTRSSNPLSAGGVRKPGSVGRRGRARGRGRWTNRATRGPSGQPARSSFAVTTSMRRLRRRLGRTTPRRFADGVVPHRRSKGALDRRQAILRS